MAAALSAQNFISMTCCYAMAQVTCVCDNLPSSPHKPHFRFARGIRAAVTSFDRARFLLPNVAALAVSPPITDKTIHSCSGDALVSINEVNVHQAQLVSGKGDHVFRRVYHLGISKPPRVTQPLTLSGIMGWEMSTGHRAVMLCGWGL